MKNLLLFSIMLLMVGCGASASGDSSKVYVGRYIEPNNEAAASFIIDCIKSLPSYNNEEGVVSSCKNAAEDMYAVDMFYVITSYTRVCTFVNRIDTVACGNNITPNKYK